MTNRGQLQKMAVRLAEPIEYRFNWVQGVDQVANSGILVNEYLGKQLSIQFTGKINCIGCNRSLKKTYQQGYCFQCTQKLAACDMCILKPENCHYAEGTCREPAWGLAHCFVPHIVYLANSSGIKVGITRETQVPTRWIDQGAAQALPIIRVKSRFQAGLIEVSIAKLISDKTDWRKMLLGGNGLLDLPSQRDKLFSELASNIQQIAGKFKFGDIEMLTAEKVVILNYPVLEYPTKIVTLDFTKTPLVKGTLLGIKGQYLMFDCGVINMRKFTGYEVEIN